MAGSPEGMRWADEAAATMLDFLYEIAYRLKSYYADHLYRYHNGIDE